MGRPLRRVRRGASRPVTLAALGCAFAFALTLPLGCSQTPTTVPVRTFERASRMAAVCMNVFPATAGLFPLPLSPDNCYPKPVGLDDGSKLPNQLFAVVTQTARGEVAVVNITGEGLVDQSLVTPGFNFLPVGAFPTDVVAAPDGRMIFVAAAETNKPAIYGLASHRILGEMAKLPPDGETARLPPDPAGPTTAITSWPVCLLPQRPGALSIVPRAGAVPPGALDYELAVVLPGDRINTAKFITLDPRPFLRASPRPATDGSFDYGPGTTLTPGVLEPCPVVSAVELAGPSALPSAFLQGDAWASGTVTPDGRPVDLTCQLPSQSCPVPACCADATCGPSVDADAGPVALDLGPLDPPRLASVASDGSIMYVADQSLPIIHVVDVSSAAPRELPPLLATSLANPTRRVSVRDLAVSPETRDFKKFLYAVDGEEGSILVYDVTDPESSDRTPLRRPHPELNPFQPLDRIVFSSPVVTLSIVRHDFPLGQINQVATPNAGSGLLCNPNPLLDSDPSRDLGFYYRANSLDPTVALGPGRLRGIFALATLSTGSVAIIDIDDWDGPCRRPADMTLARSDLALPFPAPTSELDIDPFHSPTAALESVTDEGFFPVSAAHRLRSRNFLRNTVDTGDFLPRIDGTPQVQSNGRPLSVPPSQGSEGTPTMRPVGGAGVLAATAGDAGTVYGPAFSFEVPDVHIDQDWSVTWEGRLPGLDGLIGSLRTDDNYQSLILDQTQGQFCSRGVEDWALGTERAGRIVGAVNNRANPGISASTNRFTLERLERRIADYVELTDEILDVSDPYWSAVESPEDACWDPSLVTPAQRQQACATAFGPAENESPERDFPILEAYDTRLVLGRFYTFPETDSQDQTVLKPYREVIYKDPSSAAALKLARCCFHRQPKFRVRTGSLWSSVAYAPGGRPGLGFFSHLNAARDGRCVASCDASDALLNGRAPLVPAGLIVSDRNSPLALRNPMFAFAMVAGNASVDRDTVTTFSTRGQFVPLTVELGATTSAVNPQSMKFVEPLGQVAVVDGASQGLLFIDLASLALARAPYF